MVTDYIGNDARLYIVSVSQYFAINIIILTSFFVSFMLIHFRWNLEMSLVYTSILSSDLTCFRNCFVLLSNVSRNGSSNARNNSDVSRKLLLVETGSK